MEINRETEYTTRENVASYLVMQGQEIDRLIWDAEKNQVYFVFEKSEALMKAIQEFKANAMLQVYLVKLGQLGYQTREFKRNMNNNQ